MNHDQIRKIVSQADDIAKLKIFAADVARKVCHIHEQDLGEKGVDFCAIVAESEVSMCCRAAAAYLVKLNLQLEAKGNSLHAIRAVIFAALVGSYECLDRAKHNTCEAVIHALDAAKECKKTKNRIINCIDRFDRDWKKYQGSK